ncbi:PqqD family protein [Tunturiibacter empetritectus]|uniref:PqqD family protein n=1 Tax=Tunturiibacter lichenicola TaxID=2051959 RepID=A0A852VLU3_9BACT|nr:PqqD family protein [Edaphobacter lichenicola]NYF91384.1 hypothetical protein [Edaphobacter lichenicola]
MSIGSNHIHTVTDQDGAAILDIEHGTVTTLNSTGAFVWQRLERGEGLQIIAASLSRDTGEDVLTVERDVREFVESLKQNNLLSRPMRRA